MPPRVSGPQGLSVFNLCLRPAAPRQTPALQPLVQKANLTQDEKKRLRKQQPYKWAQIQQRKAVKVERQEEIKKARAATWGNPIHGITTPFVESFDSAGQASVSKILFKTNENGERVPAELPTDPELLNHNLTKQELEEALSTAYQLTKPLETTNRALVDSVSEAQELKQHEERHRKAVTALQRITSIENANDKSRLVINVRRCVETFGRHNTDKILRPKPRAPGLPEREPLERGGPDTGSSEVQIAILTAKIRVLAKIFEGRYGHKDKANRRNLRLLVHRRQRLLKYMERKERGSERWQNMLRTLGLTEATWKQQITV
ncbi:hypothetical protein SEUCBS139899_008995 [Sporothrix eucalyptigena]|uniref:Ribosomal protein S15 n=1 Tax=Sporothrix eucalyptigena TaxID=1812306 RepID=A0ABP0AMG5_9PEZI